MDRATAGAGQTVEGFEPGARGRGLPAASGSRWGSTTTARDEDRATPSPHAGAVESARTMTLAQCRSPAVSSASADADAVRATAC